MVHWLIHSRVGLLAGIGLLSAALLVPNVGSAFAASSSDDTWSTKSAMIATTTDVRDFWRDRVVVVVLDHPKIADFLADHNNDPRIDRLIDNLLRGR